MTCISKSALVPHTAQQMFELVCDVENYEQFLPWCSGSRVLSQNQDEIRGQIDISHSGLNKSFTTVNRVQVNKMIEMRLVEGPFKHLQGFWRFDAIEDLGCKISLDLEFEFSSKMMNLAFGPVFSQIANSMVDAFIQRAEQIHGK